MQQINHQERRHMVTCARGKIFGSRNSMACYMHDKLKKDVPISKLDALFCCWRINIDY